MEEKEFDYINVVPLVDVMLVLLTIVLMTSTFIATGGIPVHLPSASKNIQETCRTQSIEIDQNETIYVNGQRMNIASLQNYLAALDRKTPLLIRADRDLRLQVFVNVLDLAKKLRFVKVSLQTEGKI